MQRRPSELGRLDTEFDGQVMRVALMPQSNSIYLAYFEPFSHERHLDLIGPAANSEYVSLQGVKKTPTHRCHSMRWARGLPFLQDLAR